jgi:CBS domain containing-hemolysin-like protein
VLAVLALIAGNAFFVIGEYAVVTARRAAWHHEPRAVTRARARRCASWTIPCA